MMQATGRYADIWTWPRIRAYPVRTLGIIVHLLLRTLFGALVMSISCSVVPTAKAISVKVPPMSIPTR